MISLDQIVSSNLEMLKEQEAELQKSLDFVRKGIELFESQGTGDVKRGRRRGRPGRSVNNKSPRKRGRKVRTKGRSRKVGTHLERILTVLKASKEPMNSGELIDTLFKQQSDIKDRKKLSTLIYPTLTKAYKNKILRLKGKKLYVR